MVQFSPFSGFRYDLSQVGALSEVTCPTAEHIDPELQDDLYQRHPCNAVRLVLNRDEPGDASPAERCDRADDFFQVWKKERILLPEHEASVYFYQQIHQCSGVTHSTVSVLGRINSGDVRTADLVTVTPVCESTVADRQQLLRLSRTQFVPVHALIFPHNAVDNHAAVHKASGVLSELLPLLYGLTPVELTDQRDVTHRLWPVSDRRIVQQLQEQLSGCQAVIVGEAEQFLAARRDPATSGESDVMMCLTEVTDNPAPSGHRPVWETLPSLMPLPGADLLSAHDLTDRLSTDFRVQLAGRDVDGLADAIELAALNDLPAVVVGWAGGDWAIVSEHPSAPAATSSPTSNPDGNPGSQNPPHHPNARWQLAARVLRQWERPDEPVGERSGLNIQELSRKARYPHDAAEALQMAASERQMAMIIPAVAINEILQTARAVVAEQPTDPIVGLRMSLAPLAGLVFNSLEH